MTRRGEKRNLGVFPVYENVDKYLANKKKQVRKPLHPKFVVLTLVILILRLMKVSLSVY